MAEAKPSLLDATHPFAATLNSAVIYIAYLLGLGAGFWLGFSPPLTETWAQGALFFGGLVITLLLQTKFARKIWAENLQNSYMNIAVVGLLVLFAVYVVLRIAFLMDYEGRDLVIGWSLLPQWVEECAPKKLFEATQCIKHFGDLLEGSARADVFYGRGQITVALSALQLGYCFTAFALIFALTGLLEMLRPLPKP